MRNNTVVHTHSKDTTLNKVDIEENQPLPKEEEVVKKEMDEIDLKHCTRADLLEEMFKGKIADM